MQKKCTQKNRSAVPQPPGESNAAQHHASQRPPATVPAACTPSRCLPRPMRQLWRLTPRLIACHHRRVTAPCMTPRPWHVSPNKLYSPACQYRWPCWKYPTSPRCTALVWVLQALLHSAALPNSPHQARHHFTHRLLAPFDVDSPPSIFVEPREPLCRVSHVSDNNT
jgi:hypothetical protein